MFNNISLDRVQVDNNFDFKQKLTNTTDGEDNPYNGIGHTCRYYELNEFKTKFSDCKRQISFLSFNIRGLVGNWEEFQNLLCSLNKENHFKLTVIGVQEVWNVPEGINFDLP